MMPARKCVPWFVALAGSLLCMAACSKIPEDKRLMAHGGTVLHYEVDPAWWEKLPADRPPNVVDEGIRLRPTAEGIIQVVKRRVETDGPSSILVRAVEVAETEDRLATGRQPTPRIEVLVPATVKTPNTDEIRRRLAIRGRVAFCRVADQRDDPEAITRAAQDIASQELVEGSNKAESYPSGAYRWVPVAREVLVQEGVLLDGPSGLNRHGFEAYYALGAGFGGPLGWFLLTHEPTEAEKVGSDDIADARIIVNGEGAMTLHLRLRPAGAARLEQLSGKSVGRRLALVLDGSVIAQFVVQQPLRDHVALTLGAATSDQQKLEAEALAVGLRSGALPAPLKLLKETTIPPAGK